MLLPPDAEALVAAAEAAVPGWTVRCVQRRAREAGLLVDEVLVGAAEAAGRRAGVEVGDRLRRLLALDVDEQRTNPLAVLRDAVRYPTEVLQAAGVPPVERDEFQRRAFPDDHYDLAPATWAEVDESLHDPGIAWGARKAMTVLQRRRAEGRR